MKTSFYKGEKEIKIDKLHSEDIKRFGELSNFLTCSPALCNNPDAPVKDRIISQEVKEAIDQLLSVRNTVHLFQCRSLMYPEIRLPQEG